MCACAPDRRERVGAEGSRGRRRVHSQRTNGSRVLLHLGFLGTLGSLREEPGGGGESGKRRRKWGEDKMAAKVVAPLPHPCSSRLPQPNGLRSSGFEYPRCLRLRLRDTARVAGSGFQVQEVARPPRGLPAKCDPVRRLDVPALSQLPRVFVTFSERHGHVSVADPRAERPSPPPG